MQSSTSLKRSTSLLPRAIGFGIISFYVLFTLLPNSNSLMVKWPWVFIWQFGLMLGPVMLISQLWQQSFRRLGSRLDGLAIAWSLLLIFSAAFAQFRPQAIWYGWAAFCGIAFLYVVHNWLISSERAQQLLTFQGILSIVFSSYSLTAWLFQTVQPYLHTLDQLKSYGIERSFDLQILTLRNWHPLGHQNYVAGYLLLAIPLLAGLALSSTGAWRFGWLGGCAISLLTLYSTASRGSWFGLFVSVVVFLAFTAWHYPKLRKRLLGFGAVSFIGFAVWGVSSPRIKGLFSSLLNQGDDGELSYRAVTNATGWFMGMDRPLFGAGLGGVPLLYQKYRPAWAGQNAELTYQLHSTPAQLWAELGFFGVLLSLVSGLAVIYLSVSWCKARSASPAETQGSAVSQFSTIGIISGLLGYGVYAITDYQLDNICISGTLIIYVVVLVVENRAASQSSDISLATDALKLPGPMLSKKIAFASSGFLLAISIWLYPVHRAWMLSSQGFFALQQDDVAGFVARLEQAHTLAPWEPYYPYQLAWNLGELAFQSTDAVQQEALRQDSVRWFEKAIALSPYQEFGYSNLGWLLVNTEPKKATKAFLQSIKLVPEKTGAYFALGYSLLNQGKIDLATQSMVVALMKQPLLLTSAVWQSPELQPLYPQILDQLELQLRSSGEEALRSLASQTPNSAASTYQTLGMLHWWKGEYDLAEAAFSQAPTDLNQLLLLLVESSAGDSTAVRASNELKSNAMLAAWAKNPKSELLLLQTVLSRDPNSTYIDEAYYTTLVSDIQASIADSSTFDQWLKRSAPSRQRRNQRLGFGTISRHIDGPLPRDFSFSSENILMTDFLSVTLPSKLPTPQAAELANAVERTLSAKF